MESSSPSSNAPSFPRIKRRILVIKKSLQAKLVLLVVGSAFLAFCLMSWHFFGIFGREAARPLMDPGLYELYRKSVQLLFAKMTLYLMVLGIVSLYLSHKWAGPVYRFERSARVVGEGDLTHRVHLRRGDELMELQDEFNAMVQSLQDKVSKDAHLSQRVSKQLTDLMQEKEMTPEILRRLREIKAEVDHLAVGFKV
jgi:methyl-accepting chemotaxis protein